MKGLEGNLLRPSPFFYFHKTNNSVSIGKEDRENKRKRTNRELYWQPTYTYAQIVLMIRRVCVQKNMAAIAIGRKEAKMAIEITASHYHHYPLSSFCLAIIHKIVEERKSTVCVYP